MRDTDPFSPSKRAQSFVYAIRGCATLLRTQHNAWIHAVATAVVLGLAVHFSVDKSDGLWLLIAIALVWLSEGFNTAIEFLADAVSTEYDENIKHAKDVAAGSVLIAAFVAVLIGVCVFYPYVFPG